jgi:hypothetical protein
MQHVLRPRPEWILHMPTEAHPKPPHNCKMKPCSGRPRARGSLALVIALAGLSHKHATWVCRSIKFSHLARSRISAKHSIGVGRNQKALPQAIGDAAALVYDNWGSVQRIARGLLQQGSLWHDGAY